MSDRTAWGEKAHLDLLLAVLNNITITSSDWDSKILPELRAKGYTYSVSAALYAFCTHFYITSPRPKKKKPRAAFPQEAPRDTATYHFLPLTTPFNTTP